MLFKAAESISEKVTENPENNNLAQGILKYCERVQKYPLSRLSSALHSFGTQTSTSLKVTSSACLKRARKGKIHVQPEAVKRRKVSLKE